jgi:UDP-N-acetylglucosamine 2-epimerase (non-hydrolysing)
MPNPFGLAPRSVAVVLGTRPEIIKLVHVIALLGDAVRILHTGQHYDHALSGQFFEDLELVNPEIFLEVGGHSRAHQIGEAAGRLESNFQSDPPRAVVVQGDTNSVLAGALAANACGIALCHVEAGLRSFDRSMPEEHNRILTDHLADLCCAPTEVAADNLASEGIGGHRVVVTGNTVVEAVLKFLPGAEERKAITDSYPVPAGGFALATFHRPENVDHPDTLRTILDELSSLPLPVLFPIHPRTRQQIDEYQLGSHLRRIWVIPPIGYRHFLALAREAAVLISDSGGIAEEASVLKRPLVVVRKSTERPEVIGTFARRVEPGPEIGETAIQMIDKGWAHLEDLPSPYGDGSASARSIEALMALLG